MKTKKTNIKKSSVQYYSYESLFIAVKTLCHAGIKKQRIYSKFICSVPLSKLKSACLFSGRRTGLLKNLHLSRFVAKKYLSAGHIPGFKYSGR